MERDLPTRMFHIALGAAALTLAGCPSPKPPPAKAGPERDERPAPAGGKELKTVKLPKSMVAGNVTLSGFYDDEELPDEAGAEVGDRPNAAHEVGDRPSSMGGGAAGATQNLYKIVAPATVIVRSGGGYGTGVIYDPAGWVLTNHHVVAKAGREDFRWKVKIGLGRLNKQGVMEQRGKTYVGYVHKIDPLRDMAVVKIEDPPKDLVAVRIADRDPVPGQRVTAIGHAGIGLLWAIKDGQIAAIGKLAKHLAQLQLYETYKDKLKGHGKTGLRERLGAKRLEQLRKFLEKKVPALVIQSTCPISQGDSGGPLVNDRAELVGLNAFVRSAGRSRKESNFHVHVKEVREFVKEVPPRAPQLLPDPWAEGGTLAQLGDADQDATVDVLAMYKVVRYGFLRRKRPMAYFVDLDQDSFKGRARPPEASAVVDKKDFDPEMIFLAHGNYLHAWYDTSGDGKSDVLLVTGKRSKRVAAGYRIAADGELTRDEGLTRGYLVRPTLLADAAMSQRLLQVAGKLFSAGMMPPVKAGEQRPPDPLRGAGHEGQLKDYSRDGKPDTVRASGLFSSGYVVDVDQNVLGGFKAGDTLAEVRKGGKPIEAEFSWINVKRTAYAWYDTDDDGRFDLLLHSTRHPGAVVTRAWRAGADGKLAEDNTMVGRRMAQPDLLASKEQAAALRKIAGRFMLSSMVASGPGLRSFPYPHDYYRWGYKLESVKKWKDVVARVRMYRCKGTLVDVDRDSARKARKQGKSVRDLVRARTYDAEFGHVECRSGDQWAFYDSRGKGEFDTVLYSARRGKGKATAIYTVDRKGKLVRRERPAGCEGLIHPALFKQRRLRRGFKRIAGTVFSGADLTCRKP